MENKNLLYPPCLSYGADISGPQFFIPYFKSHFSFMISFPIFLSLKEVGCYRYVIDTSPHLSSNLKAEKLLLRN